MSHVAAPQKQWAVPEGKGCEHPDDDARRVLAPREPPCQEPGHAEDRREGEIELLLDGQRPCMEKRVGRGGCVEVPAGSSCDHPVGNEEHGAEAALCNGLLSSER